MAKGYILLLASSSPWRLHPANQNSKVFIHSVACSRASSPDLVLKNRRPEPPAGNSGAHRGRGLTAFLCFAPPGARGPLAGSEVWRTGRRAAALPCWEQCGSPRPQFLRSSVARGLRILLSCLRSQDPQRPASAPACSPPRGPRAKLELVRLPAPARRPHRRRRRARLTTALRLYCVSYGDQLGGSGERNRPLPLALGRG